MNWELDYYRFLKFDFVRLRDIFLLNTKKINHDLLLNLTVE